MPHSLADLLILDGGLRLNLQKHEMSTMKPLVAGLYRPCQGSALFKTASHG